MRKIICALCIISFIYGDSKIVYANEEQIELYAQSAVLMDGETGRVLFGKNSIDEKANASTTKILTCILALENGNLEEEVMVSQKAQNQPAVHLGVVEGESYILEDMLYALMLESFNDSAIIIAEAISGTVENFQNLMNQKAMEIGCENTYFITPNGLDEEDELGTHHTTAEDLGLIMKYCILNSPKKEEFLHITRTQNHSFYDCDEKRQFICNNHNALLQLREDTLSGKTGFTNDAGYCYVGAVENQGRIFIIVLLGCGWPNNREYKWKDSNKLLDYGINHYFYKEIPYQNECKILQEQKLEIINGKTWEDTYYLELDSQPVKSVKILMNGEEKIACNLELPTHINAPLHKNELIGYFKYSVDNYVLDTRGIYAQNKVEKSSKKFNFYKKVTKTLLD